MLNIMKYIIKKDYKFFIGIVCSYILTELLFILRIVPKEYNYYENLNFHIYTPVCIIVFLVGLIVLLEKTSYYLEKGVLFDNREHFLLIPHKISTILRAVYGIMIIESALFIFIMALFDNDGVLDVLNGVAMGTLMIMALYSIGMVLLARISKYIKTRIKANVVLGVITFIVFMVVIIIITNSPNLSIFNIPYLYNVKVGVISALILIISLTYYRTYRIIGKDLETSKLDLKLTIILVVFSIAFYSFGQLYAYTTRRVDDVDMVFQEDARVIGEWDTIDYVNDIDNYEFDVILELNYQVLNMTGLTINEDGSTDKDFIWTKGYIINEAAEVAQKYTIIEKDGNIYMTMEWKSGDYIFRGEEPGYYIMKKR